MFNVGPLELMVILIVALLVVGPSRLPEVGRSIGRGLREFRKAQDEVRSTLETALAEEPPSPDVTVPAAAAGPASNDVEASVDVASSKSESGSDAAPTGEPAPGSEAVDVARTIGRGLAELRRAREEIQRTFRVDLSDVTASAAPSRKPPEQEPAAPDRSQPEEPASAE